MRNAGLKLRMAFAGSVLFGFYALLAAFAYRAGLGLPIVAVASLAFVGFQYKFGKWAALRSVGARELPEEEFPELHRSVERTSEEMGIDKPRLMIAEMGVPNAFAVGRKGAGTVVVSATLLELLDREEVDGVLAHELAHIRNRDVVIMVLGQSIATMVGLIVQFAVMLSDDNIGAVIAGWILGTLAQMLVMLFVLAISRYREYVADDTAAQYADGRALASALRKIQAVGQEVDADLDSEVSALCIFGTNRGLLATLFATHPPVEKRIAKLAPEMVDSE